jgi:hypothetical protein
MGQLTFRVPAEATPIDMVDLFPILLWYFDSDGWLVNMAVHLDSRGLLDRLERYRIDGQPIVLLWPRLDQIRLQLSSSAINTFDPVSGWK